MNWSDERYVRIYTRDTPDWLALSFEAQALFVLLLRKVDRAGVLELGNQGLKGLAISIGHGSRWNDLSTGFQELLTDGCVTYRDGRVTVKNFIEAQEAIASDRIRARAYREKRRSGLDARNLHDDVTKRDAGITIRDESSREITAVTPIRAVPNLSVPDARVRAGAVSNETGPGSGAEAGASHRNGVNGHATDRVTAAEAAELVAKLSASLRRGQP